MDPLSWIIGGWIGTTLSLMWRQSTLMRKQKELEEALIKRGEVLDSVIDVVVNADPALKQKLLAAAEAAQAAPKQLGPHMLDKAERQELADLLCSLPYGSGRTAILRQYLSGIERLKQLQALIGYTPYEDRETLTKEWHKLHPMGGVS